MEKKPNITPTPWEIENVKSEQHLVYNRINSKEGTLGFAGTYSHPDRKKLGEDAANANAQAIVTAVNCTYGANINPEKIAEVISELEESVKEMKYLLAELQIFAKGSYRATSTILNAEKALNNIKFKD